MTIFSKPTAADTPGSPGIEIVHRTEERDVQAVASADSFSDNGSDRYNEASPNHTAASSKQGTSIWRDIRTYTIGGAALGAVFVAGRASKTVGAPATYKNVAKAKIGGSKSPKVGKSGKTLSTESTILGFVSTNQTSACALAQIADFVSKNYAACSRYYGSPQSSTCGGTAGYLTDPSGNTPPSGDPGDNTCLGVGDSPLCIELEGVDEPVPVRISYAWEWSEYLPPSTTVKAGACGLTSGMTSGACARILTNSSIPLKPSELSPTPAPAPADATTGACYGFVGTTPVVVTPAITQITSTVTITLSGTDYFCDIVEGGELCEMWGFLKGYGNNFDSQFVPFQCDDIEGDAYVGYFSNMFDHNQLTPITDGIGKAAQFVLKKV